MKQLLQDAKFWQVNDGEFCQYIDKYFKVEYLPYEDILYIWLVYDSEFDNGSEADVKIPCESIFGFLKILHYLKSLGYEIPQEISDEFNK